MNNKKGFTLIELLVVVLIIGILSAVALPQYTRAVEKSRATQGITLVKAIADGQKIYYMANGTYTDKFEDLDIGLPGNPTGAAVTIKDFDVALHSMSSPAAAHIQAQYNRDMNWYIVYYMQRGQLDCVTAAGNTKGNQFCKSFSPTKETCPESGYNCYPIK
ncbi:MAG: prepilin-type N-terminal cleavage/methylation domain-containing protein [Elusimicrobiaceae bacterium]|nr:prepilin-type N-terminal cleavage/methylation domain-containing protein [Elusimicrobiaceae bacterium]